MFNPLLAAGLVLCAAVPGIAGAQSAGPKTTSSSEAQPAEADAYQSAFDDYRPYTEQATGDWKTINATAAKIGGWRVYAKEARQPLVTEGSVAPSKGGIAPAAPAKP